MSIFILASCRPNTSYKKLSKVETEIEERYISFGSDGIVVDGDYKKFTYENIFAAGAKGVSEAKKYEDHLSMMTIYDNCLYHTKYYFNDDTLIKNDYKFKNGGEYEHYLYNDEIVILNIGDNYIDTVYIIDDDFNVKSQMLTYSNGINTKVIESEYGVVFKEKIYDDNDQTDYLDELIIYRNNEFKFIKMDNPIVYGPKEHYSSSVVDNYYVEYFSNSKISFIYNLDTNEVLYNCRYDDGIHYNYDKDLYSYIVESLKASKETIDKESAYYTTDKNVKNNKNFDKIIKSYCSSAIVVGWHWHYNDGTYDYTIVNIGFDVSYWPWLLRGDTDTKELEAKFIFRYDEEKDEFLYAGYSMGTLWYYFNIDVK